MNVYRAFTSVAFGDSGSFHVAVEDPKQPGWNGEQASGSGQDSFPDPKAKILREIEAERDRRARAALLVLRFELDQFGARGHIHLRNGEGSEFVQPQPGEEQRSVDENPFTAQIFELLHDVGSKFRAQFSLPLPAPNSASIVEGPGSCHGEQSVQFGFGQCATFTA